MQSKLIKWLGFKLATLVHNADFERKRLAETKFANQPKGLRIQTPARIINAGNITVGNNVSLGPGCMLNAIRRYPGKFLSGVPEEIEAVSYDPSIWIGSRVSATGYLTISAVDSVTVEDDVIFASFVFVSDHSHGRSRIDIPYKYQALEDICSVGIGRGCWIGEHVVIMPGVTIGDFTIIGANSVVTDDIPPKSIAVGSPAKVVRVWSTSRSAWVTPDVG